ncbi:conserved inner membrane protein [Wigglesworthia glossinidia endosymbiont of Glossina morsitans morsitans (Yale colony)]|uniref:Conserved inner membrane protein n=1 Tax=Wigglesworthia glossinidia endosymbiont of Glossina morsitans morsitans (Yale colony) TaxID=1142511 RepID=H6Q5U4_WIGGL|nr:LPS export ABC transporter permease LptG [Wigglesworthia glossinidia]AFA41140.1 conserved inner membrane protein [Wigglesworthia glossinidia endosymbiont of Glossina morsitans morsitans (Yale colony)]
MFKILDRYIFYLFFKTTFSTLCMLVSFSSIVKFIDRIRQIQNFSLSLLDIAYLTILSLPKEIEELFPIVILISTLWSIGILEINKETIAIELSGISRTQISASILKSIFVFLLIYIFIIEWIIPKNQKIEYYYLYSKNKNSQILKRNNLWIKNKNHFIFIYDTLYFDSLSKINIYTLNSNNQIEEIYYINHAFYKDKKWILYKVKKIKIFENKIIESKKFDKIFWNTDLVPKTIQSIAFPPETLSIINLYNYIYYLKNNAQVYKKYQIIFWNKLFSPLFIFIIMLTILRIVFGKLYYYNIKIKILFGISLGFIFYFLNNICNSITIIYPIPTSLGVFIPAFILIGINLIIKKKIHV